MNNSIGHLTEADIARLAESASRSLFQTLAGEFRRDNPAAYEWLLRHRSRINDWIANAIRMEMEIETGRRLDRVPPAGTKSGSPSAGTALVSYSHQHPHQ